MAGERAQDSEAAMAGALDQRPEGALDRRIMAVTGALNQLAERVRPNHLAAETGLHGAWVTELLEAGADGRSKLERQAQDAAAVGKKNALIVQHAEASLPYNNQAFDEYLSGLGVHFSAGGESVPVTAGDIVSGNLVSRRSPRGQIWTSMKDGMDSRSGNFVAYSRGTDNDHIEGAVFSTNIEGVRVFFEGSAISETPPERGQNRYVRPMLLISTQA
jgi:hypothetical protein